MFITLSPIVSSALIKKNGNTSAHFPFLSWTAGRFFSILLLEERAEFLVLLPCWRLLMPWETSLRRTTPTVPSSTLCFKGSVMSTLLWPLLQMMLFSQLFSPFLHGLVFRKPLTTLAVQEWCMICKTMSLLWIWIMFIQFWRLDRYFETLYKVHRFLLSNQNMIKLVWKI